MGMRWIGIILAVFLLLACGSKESEMERGVTVDEEVAVPASSGEMKETEAKRRAELEQQDERAEAKDIDKAQEEAVR